jgi:hypothetical protein
MSYYDFDRFWEPERVCGQKDVEQIPKSKWAAIKEFWQKNFPEIFDRRRTKTKKNDL